MLVTPGSERVKLALSLPNIFPIVKVDFDATFHISLPHSCNRELLSSFSGILFLFFHVKMVMLCV